MTRSKLRNVLSIGLAAAVLTGCAASQPDLRPLFRAHADTAEDGERSKLHARAVAAFQAGHFGNALRDFRMVLEREPGNVGALNGLAAAYDRIGRADLAVRHYEKALAFAPTSVQTLNNLGYSYLLQRRPDLAYVYLAKAHAGAPGDTQIANNYEAALAELGESPRPPQLAAVAPVQPVETERLPLPGSYRFERLSARVQKLIAQAPDPDIRGAERTKAAATPARRPAEVVIATAPRAVERRGNATAVSVPALEISNGTGRARMAARMAAHLEAIGLETARLSNAPDFERALTTIHHAPGHAEAAWALARALPFKVGRIAPSVDGPALRLELGADLLDYDTRLIRAGADARVASAG